MTDDEIIQYLATIKPVYTEQLKARLAAIRVEMQELKDETAGLNLAASKPPPMEVVDEETWEKERKRQASIVDRQKLLIQKTNRLRSRQQVVRFLAEKSGLREENKKLVGMRRTEISDIRLQAELLHVLENRCLQIDEACRLFEAADISAGYTLSFDVSTLRGSWEDAVDAVQLTTGSEPPEAEAQGDVPEVGSPEWRQQLARKAANARHDQPGDTRDRQRKIREIWSTGEYSSRDRCAEEECGALDMSFSTARKALRNTPDP